MGESSTSDAVIRVASIVSETDAEGPGRRFAIWVQGCTIRCDGCFNPHMWGATGGRDVSIDRLLQQIESTDVEGVTFLGGEPFEQAEPLARLAGQVQRLGLSVMVFTGFEFENLTGLVAPVGADRLIAGTDLLVSGPYLAAKRDRVRPWVGSTNQQFHFLTPRYDSLRGQLATLPDRLEVRVAVDGVVSVNGWAGVDQIDELLASIVHVS